MGLNPKFDLQREVLPTAAEVTTVNEAPKAQESRKKRKQESWNVTVETTAANKSPGESSSKKRNHRDSNPNSAHSYVGDNGSKVETSLIQAKLILVWDSKSKICFRNQRFPYVGYGT